MIPPACPASFPSLASLATPAPPGFVEDNATLLWVMFGVSAVSIVLVLLLLPRMVARLPADYFAKERPKRSGPRGAGWWVKRIGKNVLGVLFLGAGVAMLFLPGQGVLTLLVGLFLVDFPGKHALERWIVRRKRVKKMLDRMRAKRGQPPLRLD